MLLTTVTGIQFEYFVFTINPGAFFVSSSPPETWVVTPSSVTVSCSGWWAGSKRKGCEFNAQMPCSATTLLSSATSLCLMSACSPAVRNEYTVTLVNVTFKMIRNSVCTRHKVPQYINASLMPERLTSVNMLNYSADLIIWAELKGAFLMSSLWWH